MKIIHSLIVLTTVILVTGSMLPVSMDFKTTTDNVSTNVVEAKHKYDVNKEADLDSAKEYEEKMNAEANAESKAMYKVKLETLNQDNSYKSQNRFFPFRRAEKRMSID